MTNGNFFAPSLLSEGFLISDETPVNFRIGFEGERLIDKKMKKDQTLKEIDFSDCHWKGRIHMGTFTINIKERFDMIGEAGIAKWKVDFCHDGIRFVGESKERWVYKVGAKLMVLETNDTGFGIDVLYLESLAGASYFIADGTPIVDLPDFRIKEWQIGAGISQKMEYFVPYFGITYIDSQLKLKPFPTIAERPLRIEQRLRVGIVFGTSFTMGSFFYLNLEFRAINENGLSLSAQGRF